MFIDTKKNSKTDQENAQMHIEPTKCHMLNKID